MIHKPVSVTILCLAASLVWLSALAVPAIAAPSRPNLILFMSDDVGYEGLSVNGGDSYSTPHLDRLARGGIRFRHAYSQPICTPSRVQIMTGKYNHQNYTVFGKLRTDQVTFGNLLRDAGYATCIVGKWQLGGNGQTVKDFGFDHHCLWHLDGRDSRYWEPRISQDGKLRTDVADKFGPDVVCDYLLEFIDDHRDQPFFAYYPMMLPHWPFVPTPDSPEDGSRKRIGKYDGQKGGQEYFDDMVAYLDKLVGRVAERLEQLQIADRTLLIYTSDNGCATSITSKLNGRVYPGGKGSMPDNGTHTPLIVHWPGVIPAGQVSDALVDFSDLLPTLLDAAGVAAPSELKLDGHSFLDVLKGQSKQGQREWVYCYYNPRPPKKPQKAAAMKQAEAKLAKLGQQKQLGRFARTQRYKLYDDGRFYDVENDWLERKPLDDAALTSEARAAKAKLAAVLKQMPPLQPFRSQ